MENIKVRIPYTPATHKQSFAFLKSLRKSVSPDYNVIWDWDNKKNGAQGADILATFKKEIKTDDKSYESWTEVFG